MSLKAAFTSAPISPGPTAFLRRLAGALGLAVLVAGCGQGEGERCEINSDCEGGLVCVTASGYGVCSSQSSTQRPVPDASTPFDVNVPEAMTSVDAAPDTAPETGPTVDANTDVAEVRPEAAAEVADTAASLGHDR